MTYEQTETAQDALNRHIEEQVGRRSQLGASAQTWKSTSANGSVACALGGTIVQASFSFSGIPGLSFTGYGLALGLGATGSLGGNGTFLVNPTSLKGVSGITFQAAAIAIVGGGFQITWYHNLVLVGHAEFYGAGIGPCACAGGGSFS